MSAQTMTSPSWLDGLVDILQARRRTWLAAAVAVVLLGALVALLWPALLPPTLLVGAVVGLVAVLLATAVAVALDSADVVVRGPRHVVASGGEVAGTISRSPADIAGLLALIDQHAGPAGGVRVALTPASRSAGVPGARANMIAEELARRDHKVLATDLTRGRTPAIGLSDVLSGDRKLAEAVRFDEQLYLAHLAVGSEPDVALHGFADWAASLPSDLDVLVAALPPLAEPGVLAAVRGVELVLVLVEIDRTERVDLIACLDAIDAAGVPARLVLVDPDLDVDDRPSTTVAVLEHGPDEEESVRVRHDVGLLDTPAPERSDVEVLDQPPGESDPVGADDAPEPDDPGVPDEPLVVADPAGFDEPPFDEDESDRDPAPTAASDPTEAMPPVAEAGAQASDDATAAMAPVEHRPSDPDRTVAAGPTAAGAAMAAGAVARARSDRQEEPARPAEPTPRTDRPAVEEIDEDDQPRIVEPGGGHVRPVRHRPAEQAPAAPTPASSAPRAATPEDATEPEAPARGPVGQVDDIDETAREAARMTAALHDLAAQVWDRGEGRDDR